ncbi:efflux RND transporter periplasmic adaptor subunit [uncultured Shimia sp.]|uniref:efflux RND transporter periplasmic adaptor subunit n=1 Tax=uncultured Shimia sp. TaxID=573152 RepID=UPI0025CDBBE0|nr:efflux RND transporter periplasmic adaptor subunit [uncultured Shimia sp.]
MQKAVWFARSAQSIFLLTATVGLTAQSCFAQGTSTTTKPNLPAVVVEPAATTAINRSRSFTGQMKAFGRVEIVARVSGYLEEQGFEPGDIVSKGDALYQIEDDTYLASVQQAQGALASGVAQQNLANINKIRIQKLVERGDDPQTSLDEAVAQLAQTEGNVKQLQGALGQAEIQLGYAQVQAPFDGILGLSSVDVGAFVSPQSGVLTTLTQLDPIYAEFQVSTSILAEYQKIHSQSDNDAALISVTIGLPDGARYDREGTIDFVDSAVSQSTDTVSVRAVFDNPDHRLRDGELVAIHLSETAAENLLTVPLQAIQRDMVGAYVLTVDADGMVARADVKVGEITGGRVEVTAGLSEGTKVITEGVNKARPGITVDAALKRDNGS